jgi:hypothetical protein
MEVYRGADLGLSIPASRDRRYFREETEGSGEAKVG